MTITVTFLDHRREPKCPPDPRWPDGIDVDLSGGADWVCSSPIPYPAPRCGAMVVECDLCRQVVAITVAGRRDDPRSVKIACRRKEGSP